MLVGIWHWILKSKTMHTRTHVNAASYCLHCRKAVGSSVYHICHTPRIFEIEKRTPQLKRNPRMQGIEEALVNVEDLINANVGDKSIQELSVAYR